MKGVVAVKCLKTNSGMQGKKRFDLDPPRGPFGTKVRLDLLL